MTTTEEARAAVLGATRPEDVFGPAGIDDATRRAARRTFRRIAFLVHPDRAGEATAFARLEQLYRDWQTAAAPAAEAGSVVISGRVDSYVVGELIAQGSVASVYRGGGVVLKIARRSASNPLLDGERRAYRALGEMLRDQEWLRPYYPRLVDVAALGDPSGPPRQVNVFAELTGFVTLAQVRRAFPEGLDGRDWAWMYRRLLRAVAGAHLAGVVHGAIVADNVLIQPDEHGVVLAGWSFATPVGRPLPALTKSGQYPPEALAGRPVDGKADIHQLHTLMLDLLAPTEDAQRAYARLCRQDNPRMRPTAAALLEEYDELIGRLYGPRHFRPFTVPTTAV